MPLGFERLNERQQRPNALINFIKPLETPHKATSHEFLSRIAAQCYPVMKKHHISVMALEEYAPNPEFLGRNFNAGEVIQLVLKDRQGRWLSMKFVQMVMMHELAHCKQMNHSRFFWNVRNDYAKQMEGLWQDGYMGEGMWGRGRGLENGSFVHAAPPDNSQIPEHLCGGSYRRRGRKRKRGQQKQSEKLTYAERQQRRISRKFGKHGGGESLGDDELVRGALESMNGGKRGQGKPKVANSKRGRELRAAAALARFEHAKRETPESTPGLEDELGSDSESDWEEDALSNTGDSATIISDGHGRDLVKVCGDGEDDEEGAGKEMDELRMLSAPSNAKATSDGFTTQPVRGPEGHVDTDTKPETEDDERAARRSVRVDKTARTRRTPTKADGSHTSTSSTKTMHKPLAQRSNSPKQTEAKRRARSTAEFEPAGSHGVVHAPSQPDNASVFSKDSSDAIAKLRTCPICSLENDPDSPTCMACSNVLRPKLIPNHWSCVSEACKESKYINAGDVGRCGLCGAAKPNVIAKHISASDGVARPIGITRPEVLRWD